MKTTRTAEMLSRRATRARRGERGVAMFIVMMLIVMVSAAGVIVTRSASLEIRSAGFVRQAGQTHYVAESGATAVIARLRLNCQAYVNDFLRRSALDRTTWTDGCPEVSVSSSEVYRKPCYRFASTDPSILGSGASIFQTASGMGSTRVPGSFGAGYLSPSFGVTVTELYGETAAAPGSDVGGSTFSETIRQSRLMIDVTGTTELDRSLAAYAVDTNNVAHGAEALRAISVILCSN